MYASKAESASPANAIERKSFVLEVSKANVSMKAAYEAIAVLDDYVGGIED